MKKSEIEVGKHYTAKVSGQIVMVRVNAIRPTERFGKSTTVYDVTNLNTGRKVTFKSAQRFRAAKEPKANGKTMPSYPGGPRRSIEPYVEPHSAVLEQSEDKVRARIAEKPKGLAASLKRGKQGSPHLVVRALAGTGKTFSSIVGVLKAFAPQCWQDLVDHLGFEPVPSEEQQAIWDAFAQSENVKTVTYCAFNKSIVNEFGEQWGFVRELLAKEGVTLQFNTVNSLGYRSVLQAYGKVQVSQYRTQDILAEILHVDTWQLKRDYAAILKSVESLVDKCKLCLTGWTEENGLRVDSIDVDALDQLASHFDIDLNGERNRVYDLVPQVLKKSMDVVGTIDFNDQNWLPVVLNLPIPKVDFLIVDESQDLPRCKQEFVRKMTRRLILVGDVNQAIYGFAGADTEAIPRLERMLQVTQNSCTALTLTETRRCGKAIVREAQRYVPQFKAHESNNEGKIHTYPLKGKDSYKQLAQDGDMVLSRVNAPLVSQALQFIKEGRKAIVRGRDFGGNLIKFIEKLKANTLEDLVAAAENWMYQEIRKEQKKRNPSDARIQALEDRYDVVRCFAEDAKDITDMLEQINLVFAGKVCPTCGTHFNEELTTCPVKKCKTQTDPVSGYPIGPKLETPKGILFSSVHRAKGLEADRVFILRTKDAPMPHPMARTHWAQRQEANIIYIAITRAIEELIYVTD